MELPGINAHISDASKVDDSTKQENVTINASNGAVINSNSGNAARKVEGAWWMKSCLACLLPLVVFIWWFTWRCHAQMERLETHLQTVASQTTSIQTNTNQSIEGMKHDMRVSTECYTWIISNSIHSKIEKFEAEGRVTPNAYKWLRKEYEYYTKSLNGNHGVQERMAEFESKVLSGEVKVQAPSQIR